VGWQAFTHELMLQRGKVSPRPLVFAVLTNGERFIQLAHGFGPMALDSDKHPCNGDLGCFIGDQGVTDFQGTQLLQDPTFVTMPNDMTELFITLKTAADGTIKKMGAKEALLPGNPKSPAITVPYFLPLPLGWVQYFMDKRRTGKEAYAYMSKKIKHWAKGNQDLHEGSSMVLTWLRAACTKDPAHPEYSSLHTITDPSLRMPKLQHHGRWRTSMRLYRGRSHVH
jgi:hypothetical protein